MNPENHASLLGVRLKQARGKIKQDELAELLGLARSTISRYERGDPIPSDIMARICEITGCRPDWLLMGEGPMYREEFAAEEEADAPREVWIGGELQRDVPILARIPAGETKSYTDQDSPVGVGAEGHILVPDPKDENAFALVVEGNSMSPTLVAGDVIVVSPRRKEDKRFPIAVVKIDGEDVAVKFLDIEDDHAILSSENPAYRPIRVRLSDIEIVGRVVGWRHTVTE